MNNEIINQILLRIFENKINLYFESIPNIIDVNEQNEYFKNYFDYKNKNNNEFNPTFILFDKSLEIFKDCINLIENIYKKEKRIKNGLICQLYAIPYIKIYLFKYVSFSHYDFRQFIDYKNILNAINGKEKDNVRKMIKIYIFKVFFYILGNYHDFYNYNFKLHGINFFDEFKDRFKEKKISVFNYYMLPYRSGNKWNLFNEYFNKFESYIFDGFNKPINQFVNFIDDNGIDLFFMISTDLIVSNLTLYNNILDKADYLRYSKFIQNLLNNPKIKLSQTTKKLFSLFSNEGIFEMITKKKLLDEQNLIEINADQLEILLYGLRFCLQTTNQEKQKENFYSKIISQDYVNNFKNNCIPGNNLSENIYIRNYFLIEKHLNNFESNEGAYVCGCGMYYYIGPCGFPTISKICINCGSKIGFGKLPPGIKGTHGISLAPGHFRIFKDYNQKKEELNKYGDNDQNIPNMLINEYKRKIIDPILEAEKYGICKVSKNTFEKIVKKVRNLSHIGYRLLNFILYSHIFYANCLGFIENEDMKKYVCYGMTCIQMLEKDWNFLKKALLLKGQVIQIFINLIFDKLSEKIINCKELKTLDERDKFEEEIEKLLEESYKDYDNYSKIYNENNQKLLELDKNNIKPLVLEILDSNEYDDKQYPFYKYFLMTTYPTRESFIHEFKKIERYEMKYPLIANYIKKDIPEKFLIKYLPEFNEFSNFMIDYYSYKITREEAAQRVLKDEDLYKNNINNFKDKFESFIKIWEKLKPYSIKYECRDEMLPIDLNENKSLAFFLNDDGELGKGMYIASAYENFIKWQNNFLDSLIENSELNGILHHFVKNMERTIDVQDAGKNEVLNFDIIDESFNLLIYQNCKRNIFKRDKTINYMNYKELIYDFDTIEKNLGELLLPGKVKFQNIPKLRYVTFCFEGFRGNNSSVIIDCIDKYKQVPLSLEKKQIIYNYIQEKFSEEIEEITKILFSIQLLIYYLTQITENNNKDVKFIIDKLPKNVKLSNECNEFLYNEKLSIKIEEIIGVYSFIELLCYRPIINNLKEHYKIKIDEDTGKRILKLFDDKKFKIITKHNLSTACRMFMSRYLTGSRNDDDFNENMDLSPQLERYELWSTEILDNKDVLNQELNYLREQNLNIGQCFELYKLIGGDEEQELKGIKKKVIKKESDDCENDEEERFHRKRPRHKNIYY